MNFWHDYLCVSDQSLIYVEIVYPMRHTVFWVILLQPVWRKKNRCWSLYPLSLGISLSW